MKRRQSVLSVGVLAFLVGQGMGWGTEVGCLHPLHATSPAVRFCEKGARSLMHFPLDPSSVLSAEGFSSDDSNASGHSVSVQRKVDEDKVKGPRSVSTGRGGSFDAEVGLFYWATRVNGLSFAMQRDPAWGSSQWGKVCSPAFRWGPGAELKIGYHLPHKGERVGVRALVYRMHCTTQWSDEKGWNALWLVPGEPTSVILEKVEPHYRLHLGLVEAYLSERCRVSSCCDLMPYIGVVLLSVRQKNHLEGRGTSSEGAMIWRMKNKYEGWGPSLGCEGNLFLGKGWFLFGKGAVLLPYGSVYTHQGERGGEPYAKRVRLFQQFSSVYPVGEARGGIGWQSSQWKQGRGWRGELGFDQMLFFSQNQLLHFYGGEQPGVWVKNQGDLSLLGVHFSFRKRF